MVSNRFVPTRAAARHILPALIAAALIAAVDLSGAAAQSYPSRPVKVVMPQTPGGISDLALRAITAELTTALGQPVIVENRPGAATNVGARACASAPPDGYTLCMLSVGTMSLNPFLYKSLPYNPDKDFAPVNLLFFIADGLMVNPSLGVNSVNELVALSKAKPATLNYAAQATSVTVFMEAWKKNTGADIQRIPYPGSNDAALAVISGQAPVGFFGVGNLLPQIQEGKIKLLAVDAAQRTPLYPSAPTFREAGYTAPTPRPWWGLFAPAGTPKPIVERIHKEVGRLLADKAFVEKNLTFRGYTPEPMSIEQFAAFLATDRALSGRLVKDAGLQPQ